MAAQMTYEQATQKAVQMRKEGRTYPEIEQYLKKVGYVSQRTKKPVKELAVRHMVEQFTQRSKKEVKVPKSNSAFKPQFSSDEQSQGGSVRDAIRSVIDIPMDEDVFITFVKALVQKR